MIRPQRFKKNYSQNKKYWKIKKPQQTIKTKIFWTRMESIAGKHMETLAPLKADA